VIAESHKACSSVMLLSRVKLTPIMNRLPPWSPSGWAREKRVCK
jgi:hypothetical protein